MGTEELRQQLLMVLVDMIEVLSGEELVAIVTRAEDASLTARAPFASDEVLADVLNGWVDHTVWNAPKSL